MTRFARDTAVEPLGAGHYRCRIDTGWWIQRGPNGGYLAALLLRAARAEVADPERHPRTLAVHYLSPPQEGEAHMQVVVERSGRSLSTLQVRLTQDGDLRCIALVSLARGRPGPAFTDLPLPEVPPPDELAAPAGPSPIALAERWETRWAIGTPQWGGSERAEAGGWIRLAEPQPLEAEVVAAITDAWVPAVFTRLGDVLAVPTADLTVHFRAPVPSLPAGEHCFARFRTSVVADGFLEEDGEVWAPDGTLLAQSRQLAVVLAAPS